METPDTLQCPACGGLSAHAWEDCNAYAQFTDGIIPGGFEPAKGTIAHIATASCWEWECGHCRQRWMEADSPLNQPCFTHEDVDE